MAQEQLTTTLEASIKRALQIEAIDRKCPMNVVLEQLITDHIINQKQSGKTSLNKDDKDA